MTTTTAADKQLFERQARADGDKPDVPRNLYQRLNAIQGEVDHIKATGKTAFNQKAISIEDVEDALSDLFAKHGVVSGYKYNSKPEGVGSEGRSTLWLVDLTVWLVNADDARERNEDVVFDVGTSPSAAVSFALKRYYKALFHLADEEDEARSTPPPQRSASSSSTRPEPPGEVRNKYAAGQPLTDEQKKLLTNLGNTLAHPWAKERYAEEIGKRGFLGTRDFLLSAHRTQHGDCDHLAEAILSSSDKPNEERKP